MLESILSETEACRGESGKDLPMKMRSKCGKWYAAFHYKGRYIGSCLNALEHEIRKAERNLCLLVTDLEKGGDAAGQVKTIPFATLMPKYEEMVLRFKPEKYRIRARSMRRHLLGFFGRRPIDSIDRDAVFKYRTIREVKGAKGSTMRKELYFLKVVMNVENPDWRLPTFRVPQMEFFNKSKKITRRLTLDEANRTMQYADVWLKPIVICALFTGLRLSNVLSLCWRDVDFKQKILSVDQTKNGEGVQIPLVSIVVETLLYLRRVSSPETELLFPHKDLLVFSRKVQKACKRAHEAAGLHWLRSFHDYRHFFCSYLINQGGADYVVVSRLAGHKNPAMTLRYSEPGIEAKTRAISSLDFSGADLVGNCCQLLPKT